MKNRLIKKAHAALYHISLYNLDNKILEPKVPYNFFTQHNYENTNIKRISFAPTIEQCLLAIGGNLEGRIFYVHEPFEYLNLKTIDNEVINKNQYVPDSHLTGEVWVTNPTKLKLVSKIKVGKAIDKPKIIYYDKMNPSKSAEIYYWNYDVIKE